MQRTIVPEQRRRFLHENITLNLKEEDNAWAVKVLLHKLHQQNYPANAKIILEAHNRINIGIFPLGNVQGYKEEEQSHQFPFDVPVRATINFRLKIIDPNSFLLLGYAENLKEEKYAKSLLDINIDDKAVKNIYRIDFDNPDHPVLYLNHQLAQCAGRLKPFIAEMAFKDILNYLLFQGNGGYDEEHKWFRFANKLCKYDETENDDDYRSDWIDRVLYKFSENKKLITQIIKEFKESD